MPTELEGKWRVDGIWIDPELLIAGRKEEMKLSTRKSATTTVANPLKLKWVDKMKGEKCSSRSVCREIKRTKDRDEQLGPEDVF